MKTLYPTKFSPLDRVKIAFATLGGVGFAPTMPGTAGSFVALVPILVAILLTDATEWNFVGIGIATGIIIGLFMGLWVVPIMEKHWGNDPSCVVIDELVGVWIVSLFVLLSPIFPHTLPHIVIWMGLGFALFRLFDIAKPFPINRLNAQKGAFFVMIDDVLAGLYASAGLFFLWLIWQQFEK